MSSNYKGDAPQRLAAQMGGSAGITHERVAGELRQFTAISEHFEAVICLTNSNNPHCLRAGFWRVLLEREVLGHG